MKLGHDMCDICASFKHNSFAPIYSRVWNRLLPHPRTLTDNWSFRKSINKFLSLQNVELLFRTQLSACKLPHPLAVSTLRHNYVIPMYSRIWNKLPAHLRTLDNHQLFVRKLNAFFTLEQVEKLLSTQLSLDALFEKGPGNV